MQEGVPMSAQEDWRRQISVNTTLELITKEKMKNKIYAYEFTGTRTRHMSKFTLRKQKVARSAETEGCYRVWAD